MTSLPAVDRRGALIYWEGMDRPPPLVEIDSQFSQLGFRFRSHDPEAPCSVWEKPLHPEHQLELSLWPQRAPSGQFSLLARLGVISSLQPRIESIIGLSQCVKSASTQGLNRISLLDLSFNWLIEVWTRPFGSFEEVFSRWKNRRFSEGPSVANELRQAYERFGIEFEGMIASPKLLANVLSRLEDFPGSRGGGGPVSSAPLEYAAALFASTGLRSEAQDCLNRLLRLYPDDEYLECVVGKYQAWFETLAPVEP